MASIASSPSAPSCGRLVQLELENFKSYGGKQVIGPFDENFVSVIGPNGAGKSNLMDALSFVLGIQSSQLRSQQLSDLIYRRAGGRKATFASVAAIYRRADGAELAFSRRISAGGHSDYRINGRTISYPEYCRVWEGENVLIKARNFLVFQGDVEAMASKSPRDLTRLFEQLSGSEEFRDEYDRCKRELDRATEQSSLNFNRKRGLGQELRLVQEQREDVARYEQLQTERGALLSEYYLWRLLHVEEAARTTGKLIEAKEAELRTAEAAVQRAEAVWRDAKKKQAKTQKDLLAVERRVKTAQKKMNEEAPRSVQLEEQIRYARERLATTEASCQRGVADLNEQDAELTAAEKEAAEIETAAAAFEEAAAQRLAAAEIRPKLLAEYGALKTTVAERVAKERLKLESLERKLAPETAQRARLRETLAELLAAKARVEDEKAALLLKHAALVEGTGKLDADVAETQRELAASHARRLNLEQTEAEVTERLRDIMARLLQAKVERQEGEREIRLRSTLEALKRIFPGVHGRMIDLCRPSQRKYETAIATALGRNLDAIVVDEERTAVACIQYLREQRAGQATFIPLDTIVANSGKTGEGQARLIDGCRPILEVVKFESLYQRAFQYACGSAVVCDSLAAAKTLCYERDVRVKAITLDGTVIHKSGLITGGTHGQPARRWEEREVQQLKGDRDACLATLAECSRSLKRTEAEERLRARLVELETRRAFLAEELAAQQRRLAGVQEEARHIAMEEERCTDQLGTLDATLGKHEKEMATWTRAIHAVEDEVFGGFCGRIGFANIREFEAVRLQLAQDISERRVQFATVTAKLQHQIAFLRQQREHTMARLAEARERLAELQGELRGHEDEQASLATLVEGKRAKAAEAQAELKEARELAKEEDGAVEAQRAALTAAQSQLTALSKGVTVHECELDRLLSGRKVLLRTCKIEEVDLPLARGGTFADVDIEEGEEGLILFDYSRLGKQQRAAASAAAAATGPDAATERKYQEQIKLVQDELDKLAPNLRAPDKLDGAESRLRLSIEEVERTKLELKRAREEFDAVKRQRQERFNRAFKHISATIDGVYKELTRSDLVPTGGSAFLSVENSEEPYTEGIRYHAMPPMKRFLDMDQLSGGERTVAALALLFAIHSFRPAPFFILDEIDAALDSANVHRIAAFIRLRSIGRGNSGVASQSQSLDSSSSAASPREEAARQTQFLVISLKSSLYGKAGALVGIYRDPEERSSRVLTLRLSDYPE